ncbi:MAG: MATE family efflux transporter [Clostridiales Family XIII bacterium]|nr:MATE family efflux transporter [Clostridiales Family XIII bacterium]
MEEKLSEKLLRVALPISAQSLIAASLNLVDTLLVGRLGETEIAAVGFSTQFTFIFWMVLFGFTGGTITYMAQFFGKGDLVGIRRVTGIAATAAFAIGIAFFCVSFFAPDAVLRVYTNIPEVIEMGRPFVRRIAFVFLTWSIVVPLTAALKATQQTKLPLKISIAVFSANTVLCILLINGLLGAPRMGIMGAATATVASRCLELLIYLIVIFGRKNILAGPLRQFFSWTRGLVGRVIANSVPTMSNEALWAVGSSLYIAAYGRMGVTEAASVQAGNTIFNLFSLACFSIGDAMLILCGEKLGQGKTEEAFGLAKKILGMAVKIGALAGGVLIASSWLIVKAFRFTEQGWYFTTIILIIYGITLFVKIHNAAIVTGALRAGGDTRIGLLIDIGTVWCIGVPLAFFGALVLKIPVYWVVALVQAEEIVKFFLMRKRFFSRKWVKNLVRNL